MLEGWLRENVSTTWHLLETCDILPGEEGGVIDASLGADGIEG